MVTQRGAGEKEGKGGSYEYEPEAVRSGYFHVRAGGGGVRRSEEEERGRESEEGVDTLEEEEEEGVPLYYEVHGRGSQKVLLVMGLGCTANSWHLQTHYLSRPERNCQVCVFDNRGCGRSGFPALRLGRRPSGSEKGEGESTFGGLRTTTAVMAEDAVALIDFLGWERIHLVGISMGGMISLEFAARYPERIWSLTLINTHCGGMLRGNLSSYAPLSGMWNLAQLMVAPSMQGKMGAMRRLLYGQGVSEEQFHREFLRYHEYGTQTTPQPSVRGFLSHLLAVCTHHVSSSRLAVLREARIPTLVCVSSQDVLVRPKNSFDLGRRLDARLKVFYGCGHALVAEQKDELNSLLHDHVSNSHYSVRPISVVQKSEQLSAHEHFILLAETGPTELRGATGYAIAQAKKQAEKHERGARLEVNGNDKSTEMNLSLSNTCLKFGNALNHSFLFMFDGHLDFCETLCSYDTWCKLFPRLRQRLCGKAFGAMFEQWQSVDTEEEPFNVTGNIHRVHIGSCTEDLEDIVSKILSSPLDRTKPLWDAYFIEYGTCEEKDEPEGRPCSVHSSRYVGESRSAGCALITRVHACVADHESSARMVQLLGETTKVSGRRQRMGKENVRAKEEKRERSQPSSNESKKEALPSGVTSLLNWCGALFVEGVSAVLLFLKIVNVIFWGRSVFSRSDEWKGTGDACRYAKHARFMNVPLTVKDAQTLCKRYSCSMTSLVIAAFGGACRRISQVYLSSSKQSVFCFLPMTSVQKRFEEQKGNLVGNEAGCYLDIYQHKKNGLDEVKGKVGCSTKGKGGKTSRLGKSAEGTESYEAYDFDHTEMLDGVPMGNRSVGLWYLIPTSSLQHETIGDRLVDISERLRAIVVSGEPFVYRAVTWVLGSLPEYFFSTAVRWFISYVSSGFSAVILFSPGPPSELRIAGLPVKSYFAFTHPPPTTLENEQFPGKHYKNQHNQSLLRPTPEGESQEMRSTDVKEVGMTDIPTLNSHSRRFQMYQQGKARSVKAQQYANMQKFKSVGINSHFSEGSISVEDDDIVYDVYEPEDAASVSSLESNGSESRAGNFTNRERIDRFNCFMSTNLFDVDDDDDICSSGILYWLWVLLWIILLPVHSLVFVAYTLPRRAYRYCVYVIQYSKSANGKDYPSSSNNSTGCGRPAGIGVCVCAYNGKLSATVVGDAALNPSVSMMAQALKREFQDVSRQVENWESGHA
eukprot:Nk52_evm9s269 gene=Nk52_evmTU9s269